MANLDISGIISRLCENLIYRFAPIRHEHNAWSDITTGTLSSARLPIATSSAIGAVKVDGTTITITSNGTISSQASLPTVTASDNGKAMTVANGAWAASSLKTINSNSLVGSGDISIPALPTVTASDNGKVLMVVNGAWAAGSIPSATGVSF